MIFYISYIKTLFYFYILRKGRKRLHKLAYFAMFERAKKLKYIRHYEYRFILKYLRTCGMRYE